MHNIAELLALGVSPQCIQKQGNGDLIINENLNWSGKLSKSKLPEGIDMVVGGFNISRNNLETLENCPRAVTGTFFCQLNPIKTLKGAPRYARAINIFGCTQLESLDYAPICISLETTLKESKVNPEEEEFYRYAISQRMWSPYQTVLENLERVSLECPEIFKFDWGILKPFRSGISRGRAIGNQLEII